MIMSAEWPGNPIFRYDLAFDHPVPIGQVLFEKLPKELFSVVTSVAGVIDKPCLAETSKHGVFHPFEELAHIHGSSPFHCPLR